MTLFRVQILVGIMLVISLQGMGQTVEEIHTVQTRTSKPGNSFLVVNNGKLSLSGTWEINSQTDGNWFAKTITHTPDVGETVSGNSSIVITFTEVINMATVASGITVRNENGTDVPGSWSQSGNSLTFQPTSLLLGSVITVTITPQLHGQSGSYLPVNYSWSFNTDDFISVWEIPGQGTIHLPIDPASNVDFFVDWGDGTSEQVTSASNASHVYPPGVLSDYIIQIRGTIQGWAFSHNQLSAHLLQEIRQWGPLKLDASGSQFLNCEYLTITATDIPDLSHVNSLYRAFFDCQSIVNVPNMNSWNISNITSLEEMFAGASNFNTNIDSWNVTNVTNMTGTFKDATDFNHSIGSWNVSNVSSIEDMFRNATTFNQNISSWNVQNVTNMSGTFLNASSFNQNISTWDVSSVTTMRNMFNLASSFNQNISNWDVSNVQNTSSMFRLATSFNQPIGSWGNKTNQITNMASMFNGASSFNQNLSSWNTSSVTTMMNMFQAATNFNGSLANWNLSSVTDMSSMFSDATNFNQPLSSWNMSNVTKITAMFSDADAFNQDISGWDLSQVSDGGGVFRFSDSFNQDISSWDVSGIQSLAFMFDGATAFDQDLGAWNMGQVTDATRMLNSSGLSTANYDATLAGWASQTLQSGVTFGATGLQYCDQTSRDVLTVTNGWIILDGGLSSSCGSARSAINLEGSDEGLSAEELEEKYQLKIYPNPVIDAFTLEVANYENTWVTLSDLSGKVLGIPVELQSNRTDFDLLEIGSRIILVTLDRPEGAVTLKVIRND